MPSKKEKGIVNQINLSLGKEPTLVAADNFDNEIYTVTRAPFYQLEPVCCKKQQKKFLTSFWFVE